MMTALVATGPNSVNQICMLFESVEQGLEYIKEHLGDRVEITPRKYLGRDGLWVRPNEELGRILYDGSMDNPEIAAFWISFYGGCGGVGPLFLAEFPTATPIINWDLD